MNNTPSLNEVNKNSTMDPNMLTKYYKLKLMNDFLNIKYTNPKMTQSEISFQLNMSSSTIQRYRNDITPKLQQLLQSYDESGSLDRSERKMTFQVNTRGVIEV